MAKPKLLEDKEAAALELGKSVMRDQLIELGQYCSGETATEPRWLPYLTADVWLAVAFQRAEAIKAKAAAAPRETEPARE